MKKELWLKSGYGLGNRLRTLYSYQMLSSQFNYSLRLCWPLFNNLWENELSLVPEEEFDKLFFGETDAPKFGSHFNRHCNEVREELKLGTPRILVSTGTAQVPRALKISKEDYLINKHKYYNSLRLTSPIRDEIKNYTKNFKGRRVAGLQFRGGDAVKIGRSGTIEEYILYIKPYMDEFDLFYVTSNDRTFIDKLAEFFPNKEILYLSRLETLPDPKAKRVSRRPKEKIQLAGGAFWNNEKFIELMKSDLIDWYILGHTHTIFFSRLSSFGEEASFLNMPFRSVHCC